MAKRKIDRRLDSYQTKENSGNQIEILWTVKMHEVNRVIEESGLLISDLMSKWCVSKGKMKRRFLLVIFAAKIYLM